MLLVFATQVNQCYHAYCYLVTNLFFHLGENEVNNTFAQRWFADLGWILLNNHYYKTFFTKVLGRPGMDDRVEQVVDITQVCLEKQTLL